MKCPACGEETFVLNSRPRESTVYRRRQCDGCHERFTTYEWTEYQRQEIERTSAGRLLLQVARELLEGDGG